MCLIDFAKKKYFLGCLGFAYYIKEDLTLQEKYTSLSEVCLSESLTISTNVLKTFHFPPCFKT